MFFNVRFEVPFTKLGNIRIVCPSINNLVYLNVSYPAPCMYIIINVRKSLQNHHIGGKSLLNEMGYLIRHNLSYYRVSDN